MRARLPLPVPKISIYASTADGSAASSASKYVAQARSRTRAALVADFALPMRSRTAPGGRTQRLQQALPLDFCHPGLYRVACYELVQRVERLTIGMALRPSRSRCCAVSALLAT